MRKPEIQNAIDIIEGLYPADDQERAGEIGRKLLAQAQRETNHNWRDLPDEVILTYQRLCEEFENNQVIMSENAAIKRIEETARRLR